MVVTYAHIQTHGRMYGASLAYWRRQQRDNNRSLFKAASMTAGHPGCVKLQSRAGGLYCGMAGRCRCGAAAIMLQRLPCWVYYAILERSFIMRSMLGNQSVAYECFFSNIGIGAMVRPIHRCFYRLRCSRCPISYVRIGRTLLRTSYKPGPTFSAPVLVV